VKRDAFMAEVLNPDQQSWQKKSLPNEFIRDLLKRGAIKKAPKRAGWNERIEVVTKGRSKATSAVLVAPSATTHGDDMNQRLVPLRVKKPKHKKGKRKLRGLQLMTPPSAGVAPPGYYMLFVLNKKGVPSVAKWVKLGS